MAADKQVARMHRKVVSGVPPGQRQLFLDDYGIAKLEHLTRTMHQPVKRGAVIKPDRPWELTLQTRCAPAWDPQEKCFKLWMITSTTMEGVAGTTYAESEDGLQWTKPALRQVEVSGSLENNFVSLDPKLEWPANAMENVVYDPDEPDPNRRYKGLAHCRGREPIVSADGIHWRRLDVPASPSSDESNLSYDRQERTFIATVKQGGPYGRSVFLSTSTDFEHWTEPELIFHADERDQELGREHIKARLADPALRHPFSNDPSVYNVDVYNMGVFRYEGLYIGLPAMYHAVAPIPDRSNTDGFHLVQLACSRDLKTWKCLGDRKPFIGPSRVDSDAYDLAQILPPTRPLVRGQELWFYYTGIRYRYPPERARDMGAICLAVLRRDGFISVDAGAEEGVLVTRRFAVMGSKLYVNVDAAEGELWVEVLRNEDKVVLASEPVTGDQPCGPVKWSHGDLASLKPEEVALRFRLRNAQFYSFWIEE